jgi:hypothetical protein
MTRPDLYGDHHGVYASACLAVQRRLEFITIAVEVTQEKPLRWHIVNEGLRRAAAGRAF